MIPIPLVKQRFEIISTQLHLQNKLFDPFIKYVRRTYINSRRFRVAAWNHYNDLGTRPRTNNHLEGSHRQLKKYEEKTFPSNSFSSRILFLRNFDSSPF